MDFTSPSCFEAPPSSASQGEEIECSINSYRRTEKDARVVEVCKLNLQETSEFVKAFPPVAQNTKTSGVGRRRRDGERNVIVEAAEAPPTPGRPIFGFSNSTTATSTNKAMSSLIYSPSTNYFPSKWDDAQKWLIKNAHYHPPHALSSIHNNFFKPPQAAAEEENHVRALQRSTSLNNHNPIRAPPAPALILKDMLTNEVEQKSRGYSELPTKQGFVFGNSTKHETFRKEAVHHAAAEEEEEEVKHRDIGTEMTPLGSCTTSRCHTPFKSSSPMRHNTPSDRSGPLQVSLTSINGIPQFQDCHLAKLKLGTQFQYSAVTSNWSSREEEEEQISKSLRHYPMDKNVDCPKSDSDCRGFFNAWEENEGKNNCCIRYQREEAKIQAWVNLQNAKAEAQSRKLEVKIEKMRSNLEEKLMKRMTIVNRKAEELRRTAQLQHCEQIERSREQPRKMMNRQNTNFSFGHNNSCACFLPCSK